MTTSFSDTILAVAILGCACLFAGVLMHLDLRAKRRRAGARKAWRRAR